jgi:hypothetical protein
VSKSAGWAAHFGTHRTREGWRYRPGARQLSGRLGEFGIRPVTIRIGTHTSKGYVVRPLSSDRPPVPSVTPSQVNGGEGSSGFSSVTRTGNVTDRNGLKASTGAGCDVVMDKTPPAGQWERETLARPSTICWPNCASTTFGSSGNVDAVPGLYLRPRTARPHEFGLPDHRSAGGR